MDRGPKVVRIMSATACQAFVKLCKISPPSSTFTLANLRIQTRSSNFISLASYLYHNTLTQRLTLRVSHHKLHIIYLIKQNINDMITLWDPIFKAQINTFSECFTECILLNKRTIAQQKFQEIHSNNTRNACGSHPLNFIFFLTGVSRLVD